MRSISWVKAAQRDFDRFSAAVQDEIFDALSMISEGAKAGPRQASHGAGSGVLEIAIKHRGDAWRVVYAVQVGRDIWVVHAFQKKTTSGVATPKHEIDVVRERLKRLKENLG
jgi:phage-related protein